MNDYKNKIGRKKINQLHQLAIKLQDDFTEQRFVEVFKAYNEIELYDKVINPYSLRAIHAILPLSFYKGFSEVVIYALNKDPLLWFTELKLDIELFGITNINYLSERIIQTAPHSVAGYLMQLQLASGSTDLASDILYIQQIDHYIAHFYMAYAYEEMGNYANAIKSINLFYTELEKDVVENKKYDFNKEWTLRTLVLRDSLFLTYLYGKEKEYKKAVSKVESMLDIFTLEGLYKIFGGLALETGRTEFDVHIINYSIALDQLNKISPALKVVEEALELEQHNEALEKRSRYLKKRLTKMEKKETPAPYLKTKRSFNIEIFRETQMLSREKILEDMIEEQIKYGYKVFGRDLEVYNSDALRGRQYIIKNQSGILDLLLIEKSTDTLYVVELKRNKAGAAVYNQVKRYIDGLSLEVDKKIKGIICLHKPNQELKNLVKNDSDVELYTYHFDFRKLG